MRRLIIFLVIVGVLLVCIAPFTIMDQLQKILPQIFERLTNPSNQQDIPKPKLEVSVREQSNHWEIRNASSFPELVSNVTFSILNLGNGPAEDVEVIANIDGELFGTLSVGSLQPSEIYSSSITVNTSYKSANIVTVTASCGLSSAIKNIIINANLTRQFDENLSRFFITPEDEDLVELKNMILREKPILTLNWMALRDWVGANIQYKSDSEIHDQRDYWQFPNETITLGTGDCEDFSILLCSLLRADGWEPDKVCVVVGEQNNQYHAWVRVTWNELQYNIEPQGNGFAIAMGDILSLSGYNAKYYFNDEKTKTFE